MFLAILIVLSLVALFCPVPIVRSLGAEERIRIVGALLQIGSLLSVVWGVFDRVHQFNLRFKDLFVRINTQPQPVIDTRLEAASFNVSGRPAGGHLHAPEEPTVKGRVDILEKNDELRRNDLLRIENKSEDIEKLVERVKGDILSELDARESALGKKIDDIKVALTDGAFVDLFAVLMLAVGIYLGTMPCKILPLVSCF
ncbi:hypothetical protein [Rhodovulum sp. PH10]|uniref:hypothetical protein n=1 Tax=Rhodovulum sp. PH10 TaxID=1187851 RepID=UPI0012FA5C39|nr:hypothetical protein [Rhodovulum sp. PH10]